MSDISITKEDFKKLDNCNVELAQVIGQLEDIIHPSILKKLTKIRADLLSVLKEEHDKEEADFDKAYEHCSKVKDENGFSSTWSIYENIDFDAKFSTKKVKSINYSGIGSKPNKVLSWLDMWKEADKLIKQSGDDHHIFIEDFVDMGDGNYELSTGS